MARAFNGSNQYLSYSAAVTSGYFTYASWFYLDTAGDGVIRRLFQLDNSSSSDGYFVRVRADIAGDYLALYDVNQGVSGGTATSTASVSFDAWQHCVAVFASSTSRSIYLNGGNKHTNATSVTGKDAPNQTWLSTSAGRVWYGNLAETAIWSAALTDAEVAILALGYSPLFVRPQSLVAYWPLMGNLSPEIDRVGGYDMTLANAPTTAAHPPVMYPGYGQVGITAGAPPAGRTTRNTDSHPLGVHTGMGWRFGNP